MKNTLTITRWFYLFKVMSINKPSGNGFDGDSPLTLTLWLFPVAPRCPPPPPLPPCLPGKATCLECTTWAVTTPCARRTASASATTTAAAHAVTVTWDDRATPALKVVFNLSLNVLQTSSDLRTVWTQFSWITTRYFPLFQPWQWTFPGSTDILT